MATYALIEKAIVLKPEDDVAVAKAPLEAGTILEDGSARIEVRQDVKPGHKVAQRARSAREPVRRYGQVIGFATRPIAVGDHVHSHNLDIGELSADRYEEIIAVASGKPTKSEESGVGEEEFAPWIIGPVM